MVKTREKRGPDKKLKRERNGEKHPKNTVKTTEKPQIEIMVKRLKNGNKTAITVLMEDFENIEIEYIDFEYVDF